MTRLTDRDRHLGRYITYAPTTFRATRLEFCTGGGDEEHPRNHFIVGAFGWVARLALPWRLVPPYHKKVQAKYWSPADIERMGRDWYWQVDSRLFGFRYHDGSLHLFYGRSTLDSDTDRSKFFVAPWKNWHMRRLSIYDADGNLFWQYVNPFGQRGMPYWQEMRSLKESGRLPQVAFTVDDAGTAVLATTTMEETEYTLGTGRWSWLRFFCAKRVCRTLKIEFNQEVGNEKGSWKGGLVGTSIEMLAGELHDGAMRRWCRQEHRDKGGRFTIQFLGRVS